MAKRLVPLLDRILVEKLTPPAKSIGGVLLPESAGKVRAARRACFIFSQPDCARYAELTS